jgi:hypothetical protein
VRVSANSLHAFWMKPMLSRGFTPDEESQGAANQC